MEKITLSTGAEIPLDGNVENLIKTLHNELLVKRDFKATFDDVASELSFVISQLTEDELKRYLFLCLGVLFDHYTREYLVMQRKLMGK